MTGVQTCALPISCDGSLWGVSNNAEYEIELDEDFVPDSIVYNS